MYLFEWASDLITQIKNPPPSPSIVFLDLNMPLKSGFEVIEELRQSPRFSKLPLVVMSTASDINSIERCKKLGADLYINKVTSFGDLQKAIYYTLKIDWDTFNADGSKFVYSN